MRSSLVSVAEVDPFPATAAKDGLSEDEREGVTIFLARNPETGDLAPAPEACASSAGPAKGRGRAAVIG
jgi:hypothetical protein